MFGFIASPCPGCAGNDYPVWRGAFCGLARTLARDYSAPARLLVNRDATFLALLGLSLDPRPPTWKQATCCNPLATPFPVDDTHPAVDFAAAVTVCGLATKLEDDRRDERGLRRLVSRSGRLLVAPAVDRAVARLNTGGFPTAEVVGRLASQEHNEATSPLRSDEATARSFGLITGHLAELIGQRPLAPALERLGSAHGRLVYWRDAWDDRRKDRAKGRFNPYFHLEPQVIRERIRSSWSGFRESLADLPFQRHAPLLAGLGEQTESRHAEFLELDGSDGRKRKRKRRKSEKKSCCDYCDCHPGCDCPGGRGCDRCFDCGPGDSGCIDCCPCDGCDCCPCN